MVRELVKTGGALCGPFHYQCGRDCVHRHTSSQIIREAGGEWHFVSYAISPLPCHSKSLPLRWGRRSRLGKTCWHTNTCIGNRGARGQKGKKERTEPPAPHCTCRTYRISLRWGLESRASVNSFETSSIETGNRGARGRESFCGFTDCRGRCGNPRRKAFWRSCRDYKCSGAARSYRNRRDNF